MRPRDSCAYPPGLWGMVYSFAELRIETPCNGVLFPKGVMESNAIRYCPECGSRVQAPASVFEGPCPCPTCQQRVQFYDYPREPTPVVPQPKRKPTPTWFDYLFQGVIAAAVLLVIVVLWALMAGAINLAFLAAGGCLVFSLAILWRFAQLRRDLLRVAETQKRAERALIVSNAKLTAAGEINQGFKANFDALVAEEKLRLEVQWAARHMSVEETEVYANKLLEQAEARHDAVKHLGERLLEDAIDRISRDLTASNFSVCKRRLLDTIEFCRHNEYYVNRRREQELIERLTHQYVAATRKEQALHEQHRIQAKIRGEQRIQRELETEIRRAEAERSAILKTLDNVLKQPGDNSREEIEYLESKLNVAEQKARRAPSPSSRPEPGMCLCSRTSDRLAPMFT